ncbi:MAG: integrase core domain-containing protein [Acidimicrobiia bacterium]
MTPSEIIFHRRVRVLEHAAKTSVAEAHRVFGVSRKTIHDWKRLAASYGLDALMPKGRRAPAMPNATPTWVVEELLAEAVVRPTLGADRYAEILAGRGFVLSRSGVQKLLNRSGLGRRRQRVAALAQLTAATTGLVTEPALEGPFGFCHFAARPGDLVALDSFFIGKLKGVGPVWQLTAVDTATRWAVVEVFLGPSNGDIAAGFVDRVIRKLRRLGVRVTGVLTDNGPEFVAKTFKDHLDELEITHHRTPPRSPNHNAVCERFQGTALQECWRPAFHRRRFDRLTQLRAEIDSWLVTYNTRRPNKSNFMRGRTPRQVLDTHRQKRAA